MSPTNLQYTAAGYQQQFTANETSYSGTFTIASTTCSGIATFSPASASGPSAVISVQSVAAGKCTITVTDAFGRQATETIDVTTTGGTIQSRRRQ